MSKAHTSNEEFGTMTGRSIALALLIVGGCDPSLGTPTPEAPTPEASTDDGMGESSGDPTTDPSTTSGSADDTTLGDASTTGDMDATGEEQTSSGSTGADIDECHVLDVDFSDRPVGPYGVEANRSMVSPIPRTLMLTLLMAAGCRSDAETRRGLWLRADPR